MKHTETIKIQSSNTQSIAEFLATNGLVKQQAAESGLTSIDWLAGQFLPDADRAEGFGDWIARQVGATLETTLNRDMMSGASHVAKKVSGVVLSQDDQDWLVRTLGRHPEVLSIWRGMFVEAIAA
jgi:hypothetical protein